MMNAKQYIALLNSFQPTLEELRLAYKEVGSDDSNLEEHYASSFYTIVDRHSKQDYLYLELNNILNQTNVLELGVDVVHFYPEIEKHSDYHIFGYMDLSQLLAVYSLNGEVVGLDEEDYRVFYYCAESLNAFIEFIPYLVKFCTERFDRGIKPTEEQVLMLIDLLGGEKYEEFARDILLRFTGDYD